VHIGDGCLLRVHRSDWHRAVGASTSRMSLCKRDVIVCKGKEIALEALFFRVSIKSRTMSVVAPFD